MQKLPLMLLSISLLSINGCSLQRPNIEICRFPVVVHGGGVWIGKELACTTTETKERRRVLLKQAILEKYNEDPKNFAPPMLFWSDGWKSIKKFILKVCAKVKCSSEVKEIIDHG